MKDRSARDSSFIAIIANLLPDDGQKLGGKVSKCVKYIKKLFWSYDIRKLKLICFKKIRWDDDTHV